MDDRSAQAKYASLAEVEASLDALDMTLATIERDELDATIDDLELLEAGLPIPERKSTTFVKSATTFVKQPSPQAGFLKTFRELVAQGFEPHGAHAEIRRRADAALVKGTAPPAQPPANLSPSSSQLAPAPYKLTPTPANSHVILDASVAPSPIASPSSSQEKPGTEKVRLGKSSRPVLRQLVDGRTVLGWHRDLATAGTPYKVTLRLTPKVRARAHADPETLDFLRRIVNRRLKDALGKVPAGIWSVGILSNAGPSLHMHGEILLDADQIAAATRALRLAGGHNAEPNRPDHMLELVPVTDDGWSVYILRNAVESEESGLVNGRTISCSNTLRTNTKTVKRKRRKHIKSECALMDLTIVNQF